MNLNTTWLRQFVRFDDFWPLDYRFLLE